jgi:excisionase family DNA binding protein
VTSPIVAAVLADLKGDREALADLAAELGPLLATTADPDELFDVKGAAAYLVCKPQRIYDLVNQRRLTVTREGGRLLFRRRDLDGHLRTDGAVA